METWITFWTWLLVIVLLVFFGLTVAVAIGGFFDLKTLFRTMDQQHQHPTDEERSSDE